MRVPSGYKEGPHPQVEGWGRTGLERARPYSGGQNPGTVGGAQRPGSYASFPRPGPVLLLQVKKSLSTCFHHKHLTTACRDVFLEVILLSFLNWPSYCLSSPVRPQHALSCQPCQTVSSYPRFPSSLVSAVSHTVRLLRIHSHSVHS